LFVEGITREKVDGTAIQVPIHPSKVMITNLNLDDKRRRESLKVEAPKEAEKPPEAPVVERKKRKPRKAAPKKAKAPRKKRTESETKKEGEAETG
jgi:ribosomal protein L24